MDCDCIFGNKFVARRGERVLGGYGPTAAKLWDKMLMSDEETLLLERDGSLIKGEEQKEYLEVLRAYDEIVKYLNCPGCFYDPVGLLKGIEMILGKKIETYVAPWECGEDDSDCDQLSDEVVEKLEDRDAFYIKFGGGKEIIVEPCLEARQVEIYDAVTGDFIFYGSIDVEGDTSCDTYHTPEWYRGIFTR